jgi:hypothetical protein
MTCTHPSPLEVHGAVWHEQLKQGALSDVMHCQYAAHSLDLGSS